MASISQQYSAVVLGCGRIGSRFSIDTAEHGAHSLSHAEAYVKNPNTKLIGLADPDLSSLQQSAAHWEINQISQDAIALCRLLSPELVSICTPDHTHIQLIEELLSLPSPPLGILVEKPLALDLKDAARLQDRLKTCGTRVAINYSRRYSSFFREIANSLKSNQLGQVLGAQAIYGKGLFHNGSHLINLLRFWFGEPQSVSATHSTWGPKDDPTLSFNFKSQQGFDVQVMGIDERHVTNFELRVLTEKYRFEFSMGGQNWSFFEVKANPKLSGYQNYSLTQNFPIPLPTDPLGDCMDQAIQHLVDLVSNSNHTNWCPVADAVADLTLLNQIRQSY